MKQFGLLKTSIILLMLMVTIRGAMAECTPGIPCCDYVYEGIIIEAKPDWGVNEAINGIKITVTPQDATASKVVPYAATLKGTIITTGSIVKKGQTNSNGEAIISFNYASVKTGELTLEIQIGNCPGLDCMLKTKTLQIKNKIALSLVQKTDMNYVGEEVGVNVITKDGLTNSIIIPLITAKVMQGGAELNYNIADQIITFTTDTAGDVLISATAEKDGYLPTTTNLSVVLRPKESRLTLTVGGTDAESIGSEGISSGQKEIKLVLKEGSTINSNIQIDAKITTPAGAEVPLSFMVQSDGSYKAVYNFADKGKTYYIKGEIIDKNDLSKDSIKFAYTMAVIGDTSTTEAIVDTGGGKTMLYMGVGGVVLMMIMMFVAMSMRKRKR